MQTRSASLSIIQPFELKEILYERRLFQCRIWNLRYNIRYKNGLTIFQTISGCSDGFGLNFIILPYLSDHESL